MPTAAREPMANLREKVAAFQMGSQAQSQSGTVSVSPSEQPTQQAPLELDKKTEHLPIVIPQVASKLNAFESPFERCFAHSLRYKGIDQPEFLAFLDGLNECFITNPAFKTLGIAGVVLQQFYGMSTVQYVGGGVQFAAGVAGAAVSYGRTRAYMKAINVDLFHPAGLSCTILKSKKMTEKIGFPTQKISNVAVSLEDVPSKGQRKEGTSYDGSFKNRMKALEGYVADLDVNVPAADSPDNLLRRMGAAQSRRSSQQQKKKSDKQLAKAKRRAEKADRKVHRREHKMESRILELQTEFNQKMVQAEREKASTQDATIHANLDRTLELEKQKIDSQMEDIMQKGERKIAHKMEGADKRLAKVEKQETKSANKMRWIVITPWSGDDMDTSGDEDEAELTSDEEE